MDHPNISNRCDFYRFNIDSVITEDLKQAKRSIIVYSGYVTPRRVMSLLNIFKQKLDEGVSIKCLVRPPNDRWTTPKHEALEAIAALSNLGVEVEVKKYTHEKVILIDQDLIWLGSLNPLSNSQCSCEIMVRINVGGISEKVHDLLSIPFARATDEDIPAEVPICPSCNRRMVVRHNNITNEPFFGCSQYPKCKHTEPIQPASSSSAPITAILDNCVWCKTLQEV